MKLVIDIPEEDYKNGTLLNYFKCYSTKLDKIICNGTPLPKGHGRLIDADMLEKKVEKHRKRLKISEYDRDLVLHYTDIEMAPPIIEADKEG